MWFEFRKMFSKFPTLLWEDGQDLVEYALVVALIAFAAIAGMHTLASDINATFTRLGTSLTSSAS